MHQALSLVGWIILSCNTLLCLLAFQERAWDGCLYTIAVLAAYVWGVELPGFSQPCRAAFARLQRLLARRSNDPTVPASCSPAATPIRRSRGTGSTAEGDVSDHDDSAYEWRLGNVVLRQVETTSRGTQVNMLLDAPGPAPGESGTPPFKVLLQAAELTHWQLLQQQLKDPTGDLNSHLKQLPDARSAASYASYAPEHDGLSAREVRRAVIRGCSAELQALHTWTDRSLALVRRAFHEAVELSEAAHKVDTALRSAANSTASADGDAAAKAVCLIAARSLDVVEQATILLQANGQPVALAKALLEAMEEAKEAQRAEIGMEEVGWEDWMDAFRAVCQAEEVDAQAVEEGMATLADWQAMTDCLLRLLPYEFDL